MPDIAPPPPPYLAEIRAAAETRFGVPAPVALILGQIAQESGFRADARSSVAVGLMQFTETTGKWAGKASGYGVFDRTNPELSIKIGVWYDRHLYDRVQAPTSKCDRWLFTLSAYNGGERWVQKRQALSQSPGSWAMTGNINPGITAANQKENYGYPMRIVYALQPKYMHLGPLVCK